MGRPVVFIAEHDCDRPTRGTWEAAAAGARLSERSGCRVMGVVVGHDISNVARDVATRAGVHVLSIDKPELAAYNPEAHTIALTAILQEIDPLYVCVPHSSRGSEYAPRLAFRLNAACVTAVEAIEDRAEGVEFIRSVLGGKMVASVASNARCAVITVRPGAFGSLSDAESAGAVSVRRVEVGATRIELLGLKAGAVADSRLVSAKAIVCAGRGAVEKGDTPALVEELARFLPHGAVGCSRPLCDQGVMDYSKQVGLTGATVAPDLYIACGVSGAMQHIAGMLASRFIVSINTDPDAAIASVADVCVVEDAAVFLPALIDELRRRAG